MIDQIETDLLNAMKSGDIVTRETLRMLKSALKNSQIEKGNELSDEDVISVIQKEVKRRKEAIESFKAANRPEQAVQEEQEAKILSAYLPAQMTEDEVKALITDYLAKNPATPADMGKVMGALSPQFKGKADMGLVSRLVRELVQKTADA